MAYERAVIQRMHGYVPGKQPKNPDTIKLNTNENPYPPSPEVFEVLRSITADMLRRYPEPLAHDFRVEAARIHGIEPDHIVAVNGGDELLRLALTTFVEPGQPIGVLAPSYSLYPVLAEIQGSPVVSLPAEADYGWPQGLAQHMNDAGVNLTLLVNPHAPSGHLTSAKAVAALAKQLRGVLLIDEAYIDFVDPELGHDLLPLIAQHDNLLLLRTLSKGYSLAGLRYGYGIGSASLIEPLLGKTRDSYNVDAIAQRVAKAAIADQAHARQSWERVRAERTRLHKRLDDLGFKTPESQTNFLLSKAPAGANAAQLQVGLEARGLLVRYFSDPRLADSLRITVGTPEQNDRLLAELQQLLAAARP
ncbi:MAG: histidinol-phosphate transaminase [Polyangiales bacterium]